MTAPAYYKIPKSDPLLRRADNPGYRIGWRHKKAFERSFIDTSLSYAEALAEAERLAHAEPEKTFWPELMFDTPT